MHEGDLFQHVNFNHRTFDGNNDKDELMREYVFYMLDRTQQIFEYAGLPDTIPARQLELLIQVHGYAGILKYNDKLYALFGSRGGEPDEYLEPKRFVWANAGLNANDDNEIVTTYRKEVENGAVLIRNDSLYIGLIPLFTRYASLLAENAITLRLSDINMRDMLNISAPDDTTKASAEEYLKKLEKGKLAAIGSNEFFDGIQFHNAKHNSNHMTDLIEYEQYLKAGWFNELGLDANYNMKRERISESEVNQNSDALIPLVQDMLNSRKECVNLINETFGTNINVELSSIWKTEFDETVNRSEPEPGPEPNQGPEPAGGDDNEDK